MSWLSPASLPDPTKFVASRNLVSPGVGAREVWVLGPGPLLCPLLSELAYEGGITTSCFQRCCHTPHPLLFLLSTWSQHLRSAPTHVHDEFFFHLVIIIHGATSTLLAGQAGPTLWTDPKEWSPHRQGAWEWGGVGWG